MKRSVLARQSRRIVEACKYKRFQAQFLFDLLFRFNDFDQSSFENCPLLQLNASPSEKCFGVKTTKTGFIDRDCDFLITKTQAH